MPSSSEPADPVAVPERPSGEPPSIVSDLAAFVVRASFGGLSRLAVEALEIRLLDALACAYGALDAAPVDAVLEHVRDQGGIARCRLVNHGKSAPDRAALYNGALIRYLDFNDAYLAPRETCHPSDNVAAVLAMAQYAGCTGREFLTALAVAYQVQCRLSDVAPVRDRGFDHTVQGAYAVAAGTAKALRLDRAKTGHALALAGTALNGLRVTRTGALSNWKGLAYPFMASCAVQTTLLAQRGISGPSEVFEGRGGLMHSIAGPFDIDWATEDLERVRATVLKRFNAEIHSQSAIEGVLELREQSGLRAADLARLELFTFDVAYDIIGGGTAGDRHAAWTKEQADHSLPYLLAVALLDGQVMPEQFLLDRIRRPDVQQLLQRITVRADPELSRRFPAEEPCRIVARLSDGRTLRCEKDDYAGYRTRPLDWAAVRAKFDRLAGSVLDPERRDRIAYAVADLEHGTVAELTALLGPAAATSGPGAGGARARSHRSARQI